MGKMIKWKDPTITAHPLCPAIILPIAIPSYWKWRSWHWSKQRSLQKSVQLILDVWHSQNCIEPFRQPVLISCTVFRKRLGGDEHNLTTPFDKLVLDALTAPRGNKRRGMGIIVDDSPEYMKLLPPTLHKAVDGQERTIVNFYPWRPSYDGLKTRQVQVREDLHQRGTGDEDSGPSGVL